MAALAKVQEFIADLTPGQNPFRLGIDHIQERRYPQVSASTNDILISFAIIHAFIIWVCCMVIIVPISCSHVRRKKYLWYFKLVHVDRALTPFRIPNSVLAVAITQLISSLICLIYCCLDYMSLQAPKTSRRIPLYAWVQLMWLFSFYGYWITGWSGLCTILCSPLSRVPWLLRPIVKKPKLVNILCILVPAIITFGTLVWTVIITVAYYQEAWIYVRLFDKMTIASNQWDSANVSNIDYPGIFESAVELVDANLKLIEKLRWNSFWWALISLLTLFFCSVSGWSLVQLLRYSTSIVKKLHMNRTHVKDLGSSNYVWTEASEISLALRKGYIYLLSHGMVMIASILYKTVICILIGSKADLVIATSHWRALGSWMYLVSGVIVVAALLLQSWRIFTDLDIIIPQTQMDSQKSDQTDGNNSSSTVDSFCMNKFTADNDEVLELEQHLQIPNPKPGSRQQQPQVMVIHQVMVIRRAF